MGRIIGLGLTYRRLNKVKVQAHSILTVRVWRQAVTGENEDFIGMA